MLDFGVEFRAEQKDEGRYPQPGQQHDDAAQRTVVLVVAAEVAEIECKADRGEDPYCNRCGRARRNPALFRRIARGTVTIENRQAEKGDKSHKDPSAKENEGLSESR